MFHAVPSLNALGGITCPEAALYSLLRWVSHIHNNLYGRLLCRHEARLGEGVRLSFLPRHRFECIVIVWGTSGGDNEKAALGSGVGVARHEGF